MSEKMFYSCIARTPDTIVCSHQVAPGDFESVVRSILPNIPTQNDAKTTYTHSNYQFHVLVEGGLVYICCSDPDFGRRQPYAYLTEIKRQFAVGALAHRAQFEHDGALDPDFKPVMGQQMEHFTTTESGDQLSTLQAQVDDVKVIMTENIEKVMQRGENLDDLMDKTTDLESHSASFKKTAGKVHRKMYWRNMKMTILLICVVVIILIVLILIILFSTGVLNGSGSGGGDHHDPTPAPSARSALE